MIVVGIAVGAVLALIIGSVFYTVAPAPAESAPDAESGSGRPSPGVLAIEFARCVLTSALLAGLLTVAGWEGPGAGALLGLALWVLPVVLLAGSVLWERVAVRRALPHVGDWLLKLVAVGAVVGFFV